MEVKSNADLIKLLWECLPITEEVAKDFVEGAINGYFNDTTNYVFALRHRDKIIERLRGEIYYR